jgi:DNA-binding NtrC family response regulator
MNNILVADQDPRFRTLYTFIFDQYHVFQAASVSEAKQFLQQQKIDLLVTEWEFPDGTAENLISYLKARENIPVLLVSIIQDMLPPVPHLVKHRLNKPCPLPELRGSVAQLLTAHA